MSYSPLEVTELLNKALLQVLSNPPPSSAFPISATIFHSNYILPSRPAFPALVLSPAGSYGDENGNAPHCDTEITIKTSSHKSLTTFLKAAEKSCLLTLKLPHKQQPDLLITAINALHSSVLSHSTFETVKDVETRTAKKAAKEERENQGGIKRVEVRELYKPRQTSVMLFEGIGAKTNDLYSIPKIQEVLKTYITKKSLINQDDRAYINLDHLLCAWLAPRAPRGKGKNKGASEPEPPARLMRRDELTKAVLKKMELWHEITVDGQEPVLTQGSLSAIRVVTVFRRYKKPVTLITGFEPFIIINTDEMAEDMKKICASASWVSPAPGKHAGSSMEVLVQGRHSKAVVDYLMSKGIPKKWIAVSGLPGKK
ncbi:unnamed protein product [Cyclocybe aegerita]|uniref:SUI1 domain-containing protein n=1 Tax=Cyclocybe aegerita TaxID=1973307 RepID=A0A8S0W9C7_CYCAE|nr:unnamed protein product [Cyclocybe aegerita]